MEPAHKSYKLAILNLKHLQELVARVMQVNKRQSLHWPFYSELFILQEMGG